MRFSKYDLYHGAALLQIIKYPYFSSINKPEGASQGQYVVNHDIALYLKYASKSSSPWRFTLTSTQCEQLKNLVKKYSKTFIGLICGKDGCCCIPYEDFVTLIPVNAFSGNEEVSIEVSRDPDHAYRVRIRNSLNKLDRCIPVSDFPRVIFNRRK